MAIPGVGAALQVSIASVYTAVSEVVSIDGPTVTVNQIKTTVLASTNVADTFMNGILDGGEVTVQLRYGGTQFSTLYGMLRTAQAWKIIFSDASNWAFSGSISAIGTANPLEEDVTVPMTIKVTGKPVFTA